MRKNIVFLSFLLVPIHLVLAQQPVQFECLKIAEAIILPPTTPADAYQKTIAQQKLNSGTIFTLMDNRFQQIFTGIAQRTQMQINKEKVTEYLVMKSHNDGINEMSPKEMATYLKQNPALQKETGVNVATMELAAKMQDKALQKKLNSMSNAEKMVWMSQNNLQTANAAASKHQTGNDPTLNKVSKIIHQFNLDFQPQNIDYVEKQILIQEEQIDSLMNLQLDPLQKELTKLPTGKGVSEAVSLKRLELFQKINAIKFSSWEKKLKSNREIISGSASLFKIAAAPFDQWLIQHQYGSQLKQTKQAALVAQIAGYQEGLFRILHRLHELSKDITLRSAAFYENEIKSLQE